MEPATYRGGAAHQQNPTTRPAAMLLQILPKCVVSDTAIYYPLAFDVSVKERQETCGTLMSTRLVEVINAAKSENRPFTDVFMISHGWKCDMLHAPELYYRWIGSTLAPPTRGRRGHVGR
jgi:hypothetical protein